MHFALRVPGTVGKLVIVTYQRFLCGSRSNHFAAVFEGGVLRSKLVVFDTNEAMRHYTVFIPNCFKRIRMNYRSGSTHACTE